MHCQTKQSTTKPSNNILFTRQLFFWKEKQTWIFDVSSNVFFYVVHESICDTCSTVSSIKYCSYAVVVVALRHHMRAYLNSRLLYQQLFWQQHFYPFLFLRISPQLALSSSGTYSRSKHIIDCNFTYIFF